jgi:metal-responsive CopG/Arc/MetJ family transcriptional regulator
MKAKTSVTLAPETLQAVDELAGSNSNRSRVIERAVVEYLDRHRRAAREARDLAILNAHAEELNCEVEDVLGYQAEP